MRMILIVLSIITLILKVVSMIRTVYVFGKESGIYFTRGILLKILDSIGGMLLAMILSTGVIYLIAFILVQKMLVFPVQP